HDGRVEAQSAGTGRGSTFIVRLPLRAQPAAPAPAAAHAPATDERSRVLLVEDNADTRAGLRALLEGAGHETHEAEDGASGLAAALALAPDVVVLDIGLPGLDGYEVARRLRTALPAVGLVALTGYGHEADKTKAALAGFDAHLLKPVSSKRVL